MSLENLALFERREGGVTRKSRRATLPLATDLFVRQWRTAPHPLSAKRMEWEVSLSASAPWAQARLPAARPSSRRSSLEKVHWTFSFANGEPLLTPSRAKPAGGGGVSERLRERDGGGQNQFGNA